LLAFSVPQQAEVRQERTLRRGWKASVKRTVGILKCDNSKRYAIKKYPFSGRKDEPDIGKSQNLGGYSQN
jgi:hypothetical protein